MKKLSVFVVLGVFLFVFCGSALAGYGFGEKGVSSAKGNYANTGRIIRKIDVSYDQLQKGGSGDQPGDLTDFITVEKDENGNYDISYDGKNWTDFDSTSSGIKPAWNDKKDTKGK